MQTPNGQELWKGWGASIGAVLGQAFTNACEDSWRATVADEQIQSPTDGSAVVCFSLSFSGSLQGEAFLILEHVNVDSLKLKNMAGTIGSFTSEHEAALLVALRGISEELRKVLLQHGEVHVEFTSSEFPEASAYRMPLWLETDDANSRLPFFLQLGSELVRSLESSPIKPLSYPAPSGSGATNLGLVMDVALNVTLRFGQRRLALREVLDLTSGSVVELDRQVDEPVELVLDGRVVARGEAVIIDGNYGMRVTQVLQPMIAQS